MDFDYLSEAERIWTMAEEDFIEEYNATAKGLCTGPVDIQCMELLEIKAHHTISKYYIKLKDTLFDLAFNELLDRDPEDTDAVPDGLVLLKKLNVYIQQLNKLQMPPHPESFKLKLDFIYAKIIKLEKMM